MSAESPIALYPERQGENIESLLEVFQNPPEITLSPEQRGRVLSMERSLTKSQDLNRDLTRLTGSEKVMGIESIYDMHINTTDLYLDYFLTDEGKKEAQVSGVSPDEISKATTIEDFKNLFQGANYEEIKGGAMGELEKKSKAFVKQQAVDIFEKNGYASIEGIPNPTQLHIVRNPEMVAKKAEELRKLKAYIKRTEANLSGTDNVTRGMKLMTTIHHRRINEMLVDLYPDAAAVLEQSEVSKNEADKKLAERVRKAMFGVDSLVSKRAQKNFARLDMYSVGHGKKVGKSYQQLSDTALGFVDQLETEDAQTPPENFTFKGINKEKFEDVKVDDQVMKKWAENWLSSLSLLSDDTSYDIDRVGMAKDGKWQVIIHPGASNFAVNSEQGIIKIKPSDSRSIENAVIVVDHELDGHVIGHENKKKIGLSITERVGMDRAETQSEAGGLEREAESLKRHFGKIRPENAHYLRAMEARLKGGTYRDCMKAFYDSQLKEDPTKDRKAAAVLASDRAMRLFRRGGDMNDVSGYLANSVSLSYLEGELLARQLRGTKNAKLLNFSGVNIEMLAELHKIGMFDIKRIWTPNKRASDINMDNIKQRLAA